MEKKTKEEILYDLGMGLDPELDNFILSAMQEFSDQENSHLIEECNVFKEEMKELSEIESIKFAEWIRVNQMLYYEFRKPAQWVNGLTNKQLYKRYKEEIKCPNRSKILKQ